jgi:hypothetical protein
MYAGMQAAALQNGEYIYLFYFRISIFKCNAPNAMAMPSTNT